MRTFENHRFENHRLVVWLLACLVLLLLNSGYLYAFESPTLFYVGNVFLHLFLGLLLLVLGTGFAIRHWPRFGFVARAATLTLAVAGASGATLMVTGATRPYYWLLLGHIIVSCAGVVLLLTAIAQAHGPWRLLVSASLAAALIPAGVAVWQRAYPDPKWKIANPTLTPISMEYEGAGPKSPFFPSAANTDVNHTIPSSFFMKPESCGNQGCHPDIYRQWSSSAHHFSSFNNQWYRKSIEYMQDVVGTKPSKWCGGCHDHAVFFNGMMDTPIKRQISRPEAQAGLTCTSCHSIVSVKSVMGNGNFVIEYPPLHDLATSENPFIRAAHDYAIKVDPGPHRRTFLKPFFRGQTAEFCSACHKVHLDIPVNHYRWSRGFNDYDGWQNSGVSGNSARAFCRFRVWMPP